MKLTVLVIFSLFSSINSYRILVCYPLPVKSLSILGHGIVRHLLNDGHEVTYITTHPMNKPQTKNFRQIDISSNMNLFVGDETWSIKNVLENGILNSDILETQKLGSENAKQTFKNENLTKLLKNDNEHFDAVIVDLFESEAYAGLAVLYNCPMIWMFSMGAHWQVVRLIGEPAGPSHDVDYHAYDLPPFTFVQRVQELWSRIKWNFYKIFVTLPAEREIYEKTFRPLFKKRGRELPDYEKVIFNASLIFGNEHNAIKSRPSTPQNFKYIGGFHVNDPVKPLNKELQNLMDHAQHGVIYFSMGSFWKSKELPMKLTRELLKMFGELKETVIWKYEEDLKDVPSNVHIVHWAPQQSILAHPNCKFFISHGGLLSSIETVYFGVPTIGVPVLFDQFINIIRAVDNGYAIKVDFNYDLPQNLKTAINVMLGDETYRKKAKELSAIYHDRLTKPGPEMAHWVGHVIRTRGAPHMRSSAMDVPLYQRLYLDLLALIVFILYLLLKLTLGRNRNKMNTMEKKRK